MWGFSDTLALHVLCNPLLASAREKNAGGRPGLWQAVWLERSIRLREDHLSEREGTVHSPLFLSIPFSNHTGTAGGVPSWTQHFTTFIPLFHVTREASLCPE